MEKIKFDQVDYLVTEIVLPFYALKRDMEVPIDGRRLENDAEHSWSTAFLACTLAELIDPSLETGKIAQLAIVHDLVEIYAGDTSIWDKDLSKTKENRERAAVERIKEEYKSFKWITETIDEYESKSSPEANFVWSVDKLAALSIRYQDLCQGGMYYQDQVKLTRSEFKTGIEAIHHKSHAHEAVGELFDEVFNRIYSHEEWFVPEANN